MEVTNEVIVERIENLKEHFGEKLDRIEAQTVKTNGRVTKHDEEIGDLRVEIQSNHSLLKGGLAILGFGLPITLTIILFILK